MCHADDNNEVLHIGAPHCFVLRVTSTTYASFEAGRPLLSGAPLFFSFVINILDVLSGACFVPQVWGLRVTWSAGAPTGDRVVCDGGPRLTRFSPGARMRVCASRARLLSQAASG